MNIYSNIENLLFLFFLYKIFSIYNTSFDVINNIRRLLYEGVLFIDDDLFDNLEKEIEDLEKEEEIKVKK